MLKSKLRKKILLIRKKKNNKNLNFLSLKILKEIKKNLSKKLIIGGYFPVNFEVDILEFLKKLEISGFKLSLPVIKKNNKMNFYRWSYNNLLKLNKYGIPEPEPKAKVYPDIIFIPLVAFDNRLYRIGYGGGYYDRYIEKTSNKKNFLKIGVAFSYQKISRVPTNKYDKKLDIIITEKYILR